MADLFTQEEEDEESLPEQEFLEDSATSIQSAETLPDSNPIETNDPFSKDTPLSESDIYTGFADILETEDNAASAFESLEYLYDNTDANLEEVQEKFGEMGQQLKSIYGVEYLPDYMHLLPSPAGFLDIDIDEDNYTEGIVDWLDQWEERAKAALRSNPSFEREYAIHKMVIDDQIHELARHLKQEARATEKFADEDGNIQKEGRVGDLFARFMEGAVADTARSFGAKETAESIEDWFVSNPAYDPVIDPETGEITNFGEGMTSLGVRALGQGAAQIGVGALAAVAASAATSGLGTIPTVASAANKIKSAGSVAKVMGQINKSQRLSKALKTTFSAGGVGTLVAAGSGVNLELSSVYDQAYKETGSHEVATETMLYAMPGSTVDFIFDALIAGKMISYIKAKPLNRTEKIDEIGAAVARESDLQGLNKLSKQLDKLTKVKSSRVVEGAKTGLVQGIGEGIGEATQGAFAQSALSRIDPDAETRSPFDYSGQSTEAMLGFAVGSLLGTGAGALDPQIQGISEDVQAQLDVIQSRITDKSNRIIQQRGEALATTSPSNIAQSVAEGVAQDPVLSERQTTAQPSSVESPELSVASIKEQAAAKIQSLGEKKRQLEEQSKNIPFGNRTRLNVQEELDAVSTQLAEQDVIFQREELTEQQRDIEKQLSDLSQSPDQVAGQQDQRDELTKKLRDTRNKLSRLNSGGRETAKTPLPKQPKNTEGIIENKITQAGGKPDADVDTLSKEELDTELNVLNDQKNLPKKLEERRTAILQKREPLTREALDKEVDLGTPVTSLSKEQLNNQENALRTFQAFEGDLSPDQKQRLEDIGQQRKRIEEFPEIDLNVPVDKLTRKQLKTEEDVLVRQNQALDPVLKERRKKVKEQRKFNNELVSEEKLGKVVQFDTSPENLSESQLQREFEELSTFPGDLTSKQQDRLVAVESEQNLRAEKALDSKTLADRDLDTLTTKEVDAALQTLSKNEEQLTDKQKVRKRLLEDRRKELGKSLKLSVYRGLPKETRELVDADMTLGDILVKKRRLRSESTKAALDEAIIEHLDPANTVQKRLTKSQQIQEQIDAATDPEIAAQLREEQRQAALQERREQERLRRNQRSNERRADNQQRADERARGVFRSEAPINPVGIDTPLNPTQEQLAAQNERTGAFAGTPNSIRDYDQIQSSQPEYYSLDDTTKSPTFKQRKIPKTHSFFTDAVGKEDGKIADEFSTSAVLDGEFSMELDNSEAYNAHVVQTITQHPRIIPKVPTGRNQKPKKMRQIIKRIQNILDIKTRYTKLSADGSYLGHYIGRISSVVTNFANDIDTAAHEIGHTFDHHWGIANDWINAVSGVFDPDNHPNLRVEDIDQELAQFWVYGTPYRNIEGKRVEGVAEFVRAYIMNHDAARQAAPKFAAYFESKLPDRVIKELHGITFDLEDYIKAKPDLIGNHIQTLEEAQNINSGWVAKLGGFFYNNGTVFSKWQQLSQHIGKDKMTDVVTNMYLEETGHTGKDILPISDPRILGPAFRRFAGKFLSIIDNGIHDPNTMLGVDTVTGKRKLLTSGGFGDIVAMFNNPGTFQQDLQDGLALMVSERTVEKGRPIFNQISNLQSQPQTQKRDAKISSLQNELMRIIGVSAGIKDASFNDYTIAEETIRTLQTDPARYQQLKDFGDKYREWADAILQYMVGKGTLSSSQYQRIKAGNQQYVTMFRIQELSPKDFVDAEGNFLEGFKGSTKEIRNPYVALFESTHKAMQQADRNEFVQGWFDLLDPYKMQEKIAVDQLTSDLVKQNTPDREIRRQITLKRRQIRRQQRAGSRFGGDPTQLSKIATKVPVKPDTPGPQNISFKRNGKIEHWVINDKFVAAQFRKITSNEATGWPFLAMTMRAFQSFVTRTPPFAIRNFFRDVDHRLTVSDSDLATSLAETGKLVGGTAKGLATRPLETLFSTRPSMDLQMLRDYGGDQAGFYVRESVDFARTVGAILRDKKLTDETIFLERTKKVSDWYNKKIEQSEQANRIIEYKAAYKKAVDEGLDPINAHIYAGSQAAGVMDFTSAGDAMRILNNVFPFAAAGSVAVRKTVTTFKQHKGRSVARLMLIGAIPALAERMLSQLGGYEDEWDQMHAYLKDYFFTVKVAPDLWLRIPKSYETGVVSGGFQRLLDSFEGKTGAWDGFVDNVWKAYVPVDLFDIGNPALGIMQSASNYDSFRQKHVVPIYENEKALRYRRFPEHSSIVSQKIHQDLVYFGWDDAQMAIKYGDARRIDYNIRRITGTAGDLILKIPDIAKADSRDRYLKSLGGIFTSTPVYMARDPKFVYGFMKDHGLSANDKDFARHKELLNQYFNARTAKQKERAGKRYIKESTRLRKIMESKGPNAFLSRDAIEKRENNLEDILSR